jgi:hypothetical protein
VHGADLESTTFTVVNLSMARLLNVGGAAAAAMKGYRHTAGGAGSELPRHFAADSAFAISSACIRAIES